MYFLKFLSLQKNSSENGSNPPEGSCLCTDNKGFFITSRQASSFAAILIFLLTSIYVSGYFYGQKKAVEEFTSKVINDSFADQINYSLYSQYGDNSTDEEADSEEDSQEINTNAPQSESSEKNIENASKINSEITQPKKYYAELIGFGARNSAEQFVNKIKKKGYNINVSIIPRKSKTSKGKVITWYQVITDKFDENSKLEEEVNKIKDKEKLNGIKFVTI